jgi:hypothetical protein
MQRRSLILSAVLVLSSLAFGAVALAGNGALAGDLERIRGALARYNSTAQAEQDGYVPSSPCEELPGAGAMGIHYVNPALMAPGIDPLRPEILLYLPDADGKLKLIGVEYFQADADQDISTNADRPSVFGQPFDGPMDGHAPGMPIHYDLHVWLFEANPAGVFAAWNPAISCP